ncbi:hypothetical protein P3W45_000055 [Vairimorpha bombi]|jgi:paired amphipathic helix protein Sin3a
MSNNMDNTNNQDNDKWSEQGGKRYREEDKGQYNDYSDSSSVSKQHFAPQMTHTHHQISRPQEQVQDNLYPQPTKPAIPEDAEVCDAMVFLNRIKEEYSDDMVTYDNFLETMRDYKFGKIDADEVCKGVRILFKDKPHLIDIFNEYLPNHLKFYGDGRNNENIQRTFERIPMHNQQYPQFRRAMFNPKMMHPNMKPNNNMRPMIPKMGPPPHMHQPPHLSGVLQGMIPAFAPHPNGPAPMRMQPPVGSKMHPNFYPYNMPPKSEEEGSKKKQANEFIQRVKKRYVNQPNVYKTFVDILQKFSSDSNITSIRSEISSLLWEHPDLIEDFEKDFIPANKIKTEEESSIMKQICKQMEDKKVNDDFLRCLNYFNQNFITKRELLLLVAPLLKNEAQINLFKDFINYKEKSETSPDTKNLDKCRKVGSYRILSHEIQNLNQDAIAKEVLNTTCVSCPTFESEDANFVFLKRNMYEDCVFRAEDDRSEASLVIERLDYFIQSLEIVYSNLGDDELSVKDLGMSPGIVKEVLKNIYEDSASEILEGILTNPKTSIPVLIKRLYTVNKEYRERLRQKHKVWNEQVDRAYYKALDTNGPYYKNQEKSNFSTKVLIQEAEQGYEQDFQDRKLVEDIAKIFNIFIRVSQTDNKKAAIPELYSTVDLVFRLILQNPSFIGDFNIFCIYRFIFYVYERLKEIKDLKLKPIVSSRVAVRMNIIPEYDVEDRFEEILNLIKIYCEKSIDPLDYEETLRILTDCKGYKLYNIKKVFLRIEKAIIAVIEDEESFDILKNVGNSIAENKDNIIDSDGNNILEDPVSISFKDNYFSAKNLIIEETESDKPLEDVSKDVQESEDKEISPVEENDHVNISQEETRIKRNKNV